jgi:hypothetical protein
MRISSSRIRSMNSRMSRAEEAAFPGIRTPQVSSPYHVKSSVPRRFRGEAMSTAFARAGLA